MTHPTRFFVLFLGLLAPLFVRAQTLVVELNFDSSDFTQTGTAGTTFSPYQGTVTFDTGVGGGTAAVFDGSTSLQASDTPVTTALTVSFWMKTTTDNGLGGSQWFQGAGLVDGELGGDTTDWGLSQMGTQVAFGIGSSDTTIFSTSSVNTGNWIHVAATWDTSGTMNLYLNGALEASYGVASAAPRNTFNQFFIGQDLGGGTYTGSLDEIRIYDSALSGGQISALAAIPEPSTYALLAGVAVLGLAVIRHRVNRA
jgi:hypothetical protein